MTDKNAGAATDAPISQDTPDNRAVICPNCAHQFYAISVMDQEYRKTVERERDAARAQLEDCAVYLKANESVAECIARNRKDVISSLDQWAKALKRAEEAETALAEEKKLSAAISRDCNNTANERNEAQAKLAALQKRLADAGEGLPPEAKRELVDEVLTVEAIDYDALRAAAESIIASLKVTVEMLEAGIAADAEVIAEKDAEIARLREALVDVRDNIAADTPEMWARVEDALASRKGRG